jgi:multiple sugar transport system substrate-binding protein
MKKTLAAVAVLSTVAFALTGCAGASDDSSGHQTLTFWHGYTEADGDKLDAIIDDFNASQDDITIETETKTWAVIGDTLLPALSAKKGPEIVALPAENLPIYAAKGAFASLDDYYSADGSVTADLNPEAVSMEKIDGTMYGVPTGFVPLSVVYNKTMFEAAGIDTFPTTWDEWLDAAKKLTIDKDGDGVPEQYGLALPDHSTVGNGVWASLFYGNGGSIVDNGTATLDSPENQETLEFWSDAIINDHISPSGLDGVASDQLFSAGQAAMEIGGPWMAFVATDANIDYGIAAIPAGPVQQASSAIGISAAITAQATPAQQAAAEKFFDYFFSPEVAVQWSLGSGWPSLRTDTTADQVSENPLVATLTEIAGGAKPLLPGVANSVDVLAAVDEATQKAVSGGDAAELLTAANSAVQKALDSQ